MALSNLTSYTKEDFDKLDITPFAKAPKRTNGGTPDTRANASLKGWVGDDVLAFTLITDAKARSTLAIDTTEQKTLLLNVLTDAGSPGSTTYWTVNMGSDNNRTSDWSITYNVKKDSAESGTWVFVKGKADQPSPMTSTIASNDEGLSHLQEYSQEQYQALGITTFPYLPKRTITGSPPGTVDIHPDGWVGDDLMAFRVINAARADSGLQIVGGQVAVNVVDGSNPSAETSYYTVDMGPDNNRNTEWSITYTVASSSESGTWVFVKGKADDMKKGGGGFFGWLRRLFGG